MGWVIVVLVGLLIMLLYIGLPMLFCYGLLAVNGWARRRS